MTTLLSIEQFILNKQVGDSSPPEKLKPQSSSWGFFVTWLSLNEHQINLKPWPPGFRMRCRKYPERHDKKDTILYHLFIQPIAHFRIILCNNAHG